MVILNITDPANPVQIGHLPGGAAPFEINGDYAYANWEKSLHIIDISDRSRPIEVGCSEGSFLELERVTLSENHAYLPKGAEGLLIYNVSELASPIEIASYQSKSSPKLSWYTPSGKLLPRPYYVPPEPMLVMDAEVAGQYAEDTLPVVDYIPGLGVKDIDVVGQFAYVARGEDGLSVIDISKMDNYVIVSAYHSEDFRADRVVARDDHIFVLEENKGVHIFDVSDPSNMYDSHNFLEDIHLENGDLYLALRRGIAHVEIDVP